jgi:glutamate carboxypeptidase
MKSGFIQALYAMRGQDFGRVALIATTDEETGSAASRKLIEEISKKAKAVLVMEASLDGKLKIGRKGTSMYQITIHGRAAHAGLEPEKGINATVEISKIVSKLIALENKELGTSVVPTVMTSGSTTNTVPALASLDVDSRSFTMAEMKRVEQAIRALKPENKDARIEITGGINRPPMETSSSSELYELAEKVAVKLEMSPLGSASVGGASDGNFAAIHTKVLDGLGSLGGGAHANNEHILVSHLEPRSNLIAALIKEILL